MMRGMVSVVALIAVLPSVGSAQDVAQKSWAGLMNGGYSTGIGDDFGGGSSVGFTAGLYLKRSPTFKLGVEVGYDRLGGYKNNLLDIRPYRSQHSGSARLGSRQGGTGRGGHRPGPRGAGPGTRSSSP